MNIGYHVVYRGANIDRFTLDEDHNQDDLLAVLEDKGLLPEYLEPHNIRLDEQDNGDIIVVGFPDSPVQFTLFTLVRGDS
jgi:hypothetical protein